MRLWDTVSGEELLSLSGGLGWFRCVTFSPRGKYLYAGADAGVQLWEGIR